jgi:endonuclease/exonuclease/phosphatase family metal-dependent hydrolase
MIRSDRRSGTRWWAIVILALVSAVAVAGPASADSDRRPRSTLRVMTQNLYLGADLTPALQATNTPDFLAAVAGIYGSSRATDFPVRAAALAKEIDKHEPDLIGLQEVSRWQPSGPANTEPTRDYLEILQQALAARGLDYEVAAISTNAVIGPVPLVSPCGGPTGACLITFTDRDVILVNRDTRGLRWWNPDSGNFTAQATFTPPGLGAAPVSFNRGWASIDGRFRGERFHFVNTHLEVAGSTEARAVQEAQAVELLAGPAFGPGADLLVGDINSAADGSTTASYGLLTDRFRDAWSVRRGPGYTCCQAPLLDNPTSQLSRRIDVILSRGGRPVSAWRIGERPIRSTPPLWLSDHAGVVADLRLR